MGLEILDLHGLRHKDVDLEVENFIFLKQERVPLIIFCGNSSRMIQLVSLTLGKHQVKFSCGMGLDYGKITITKV
ncbi:uncharacterized protein METZ01_LOCUS162785 [marine metagenome]|uniref:Smr domain-containing protein n=1 Tax=marine metagenome TaxID=408172 RepID=A0A382B8R8_9ZZZZ